MKAKITLGLAVFISLIVLVISCDKNKDNSARLDIRLTDAPADYDRVLIDVQALQINVASNADPAQWVSLPVKSGIYNLLDFRNGVDTLIARAEVPSGAISQMRLVLGSNNSLVINGSTYPLLTPSAQQSGLKFNLNASFEAGLEYKLWIDFDASRSIVRTGNGSFILKPVIRTFSEASSGAISGTVTPVLALPQVMAIAGTDTLSTIANVDGKFMIKGVPAKTYKVVFEPQSPYTRKTVEGVVVLNGQVTNLGSISF